MSTHDYIWISIKLVIGFVCVLIFFQVSGAKRQLAEMTTFDLISNFILGAILGGYVYDNQVTLRGFLIITTIYFFMIYITNIISSRTNWGRKLIVGVPTIIISDGKLDTEKLKKMKISMTDFMSLLRNKKVHSLADVKLAQMEVGGELTVVKKGEELYALLLVDNGLVIHENLKQIHKDETWLKKQLKKEGIKDISDVFCAQWLNGDFYIIKVN